MPSHRTYACTMLLISLSIGAAQTNALSPRDAEATLNLAVGSADVPMQMMDGRPTIDVVVAEGERLRLVVDTGFVGEMAISPEAALRMGLKPTGSIQVGDPSGRNAMQVDTFNIAKLNVGGLEFHGVMASALPQRRPSLDAVDGVLGLGLLHDLFVTIDYGQGRLMLSHRSFAAKDGAHTVRLLQDASGLLRLPVTVGSHKLLLDLDTGNGRSALALPSEVISKVPTRGPARSNGTARTIGQELSIQTIDLAVPVRVGATVLKVTSASYPSIAPPGGVGSSAFDGITLQLDLREKLARVMPSAPAQQPFPWNDVLDAERQGCLAYETGDVQGIHDFLTDDYTLTDGKGVVTTKQDDLEDFLKNRIRYTTFQNADMKVRLYATTAIVTGQTHVVGIANGSAFDVTVQFTDTLIFLDGRWRLAAGHVSRLASPNAPVAGVTPQ